MVVKEFQTKRAFAKLGIAQSMESHCQNAAAEMAGMQELLTVNDIG